MTPVEIFGFAPSTYTRTALLTAVEKGVPHTLSPVEFGTETHRALHPFARMPAMRHGDVHLYESAAIVVYLDEVFDGPSLQPEAPIERARMWQFISSAVDYYYGPLVSDTLGHVDGAPPPDTTERDRVLDVLEAAATGGDFLVGDALTLADLIAWPMVHFHVDAAGGEKLLAKRPQLAAWLNRLAERDSFRKLEAG